MKIIFFGSSTFSLPTLEKLLSITKEVTVVSTPDEKKGRGQKQGATVVKEWCLNNSVSCITPESLKSEDVQKELSDIAPDFLVIASYGKILPQAILDLPKKGCLNVHPSLLPKYRGAAPIQRCLLNDDEVTGVSIMRPVLKLDAGDIIVQQSVSIEPNEAASELSARLANLGAELVWKLIPILCSTPESIQYLPQKEDLSTYAEKVLKEEASFEWSDSAISIHKKVRGLDEWPVAYTIYKEDRLRVLSAELGGDAPISTVPGTILKIGKVKGVRIQTGENTLWVKTVQMAGKKPMPSFQFLLGQRLNEGDVLS